MAEAPPDAEAEALAENSWKRGDRVTVDGRTAVVLRDMRPQHARATLVWEDDGEIQRRVDAGSITLIR